MESMSLRERNKARRRDAIVKAAIELFARKGYTETTIPEIAAAAELAPRTVAMHFPSKIDIVNADFEDMADELEAILASSPRDRPIFEIALEWIGRFLLNADNPHMRNRLTMMMRQEEIGSMCQGRMSQVIERAVAENDEAGRILVSPVDREIFGSAMAGAVRYLSTLGPGEAFDQALERTRVFFRGGLTALHSDGSPPQNSGPAFDEIFGSERSLEL